MNEQAKRIEKQMVQLVLTQSFFATLLLRMKIQQKPDDWFLARGLPTTMCTDGEHIDWSETFVKSLSDGEIRGLLVHEVMHPAMGHLWRIGKRDIRKFNKAADHAINLFIESVNKEAVAAGQPAPLPLPPGGCCDKKYEGMSAEEIYGLLPAEPKGNKSGKGKGGYGEFTHPSANGDGNSGQDGDKPGEGSGGNTEADWKIAVVQAANAAKLCGNTSACLERLVGAVVKPTVPWQSILERFVTAATADDYDWTRFDRRYIDEGWYFPDLYSDKVGELAIVIDTSGSIGDDTLNQFQSEVQELMSVMHPSKLVVYYADTEICATQEFECGDPVKFTPKGGGGTDFAKPLKAVAKRGNHPECLIYLTDLYGTFPTKAPPFPLIWVVTPDGDKRRDVPFGEVTRMI
jgi:predicted metal-dependent peptidase